MRLYRVENLLNTTLLLVYVATYIYGFPTTELYKSFSDETDFYKINMKAIMVILGIALTLALVNYRLIIAERTKNSKIMVIVLSVIEFITVFIGRESLKIINEYSIRNGSPEGSMYYGRANILLAIVLMLTGVIAVFEMYRLIKLKDTDCLKNVDNADREHWSVRLLQIINIILALSTFVFPFKDLDIALYEGQVAICLPFCVWFIVLLNEFVARGKVLNVILGLLSYILIIRNIVYYVFFNDELMKCVDKYVLLAGVIVGVEIIFVIFMSSVGKMTRRDKKEHFSG